MIDIENFQTEVQTRADALTGTPTNEQVVEVGIAARSVELAGGLIDRSVLNIAIQNVIDDVSGGSANSDLIALGATLPRTVAGAGSIDVGTYVTGLFKGNPKYLRCDSSTYLRSAYPELSDLMLSGLSQQISISASEGTNISSTPNNESQSTVYKVNSTYYKLLGGAANTAGWTTIPIQSSTDGITYTPVTAPSLVSPLAGQASNCQMDSLLSVGTTLIAYGRVITSGSNYLVQLKSLDDGRTWLVSIVRSITSSNSTLTSPILTAIIGSTIIVHPRGEQSTNVYYSTNLGAAWSTITDSDVTNSKFINGLIQDGTRFVVGFTDGSSAYSTTSNPSGTTWTAVTPPNANARGVLGVVSGKWIMGGQSGYVATCTSAGVWVAQTTCTSSMPSVNIERIAVNGSVIAFSALSVISQVLYCTDASTLPAVTVVAADGVVGSPSKLSLASVADGNFYLRQESDSLIRSTSLVGSSFTPVQVSLDPGNSLSTVDYGTIYKYGFYVISVGGAGLNKRYMSTDLKTWMIAPATVSTGCGAIVDVGTRLLALDSSHVLWQSTDGRVWDTTGITRPSWGGTTSYGTYARLFVCTNGWVYYTTFRNDESGYHNYVSKDNGSTWASVSGLSLAGGSGYTNVLQNPCLFKEINGIIYSLSVNYFSSGYGYYLSKSTDGTSFTYIMGVANALVDASYTQRQGIFEVDSVIYAFVGATPQVWLASFDNGTSFSVVPALFVPASLTQFVGAGFKLITNNLSSDDFLYTVASPSANLTKLSGSDLVTSSNYAVLEALRSSIFVYEDSGISMITLPSSTTPKLIRLDDTNTTFTLPNITNTWLRAAS